MKDLITEQLAEHIESIGEDVDIDLEAEASSHFEELTDSLNSLEYAFQDGDVKDAIYEAYDQISVAESSVQTRKDEHDQELAEQEEAELEEMNLYWANIGNDPPKSPRASRAQLESASENKSRSIFSDVEK